MDEGSSMEEMYEEYARPVYQYLLSLCHDAALAEELTQDTFYQAVKGIGSFRGECRLLTWLCQIGKRAWYKELKKCRRRDAPLPLDEEMAAGEDVSLGALESDEARVRLFQAMQGLEAGAREVVYLRVMGDLSFHQIGQVLGKTENWARVTFYRAKEKLKKGWDRDE